MALEMKPKPVYKGPLNWIGKAAMTTYKKQYNVHDHLILKEIEAFNNTFIAGGIIEGMSSNYGKYLRGWLVKAFLG